MIKKIGEVILIPLVIAVVGVFATLKATQIQKESSEEIAEAQGRQALIQHLEGKDLAITDNFLSLLNTPEICSRAGRVYMLIDMASYDHSIRIKEQFEKECPPVNEQTKNGAQDAVDNAAREQAKKLIAALSGSARKTARNELTKLYEQSPEIVGTELSKALSENKDNYRISLGVLVVLGSVSAGWVPDQALVSQMSDLESSNLNKDKTFTTWFNEAKENKKRNK